MRDGYVRVGCATPKVKVADCSYNADRIVEMALKASNKDISILVFPELSITGYTCQDMFLHKTLIDSAFESLMSIADDTSELEMVIIVGLPIAQNNKLYDCAAVLCKGEILGIVPKSFIPGYGEFYETRYFTAYADEELSYYEEIPFGKMLFQHEDHPEVSFAIEICEELWVPDNPSVEFCMAGANLIFNPSASDEVIGKASYRRRLVSMASAKQVCGYVYCDCGFGESSTDLVFAGHDIISENGKVLGERRGYDDGLIWADIDLDIITHERMKMNSFYSEVSSSFPVVCLNFDLPDIEVPARSIPQYPFVPSDLIERDSRCEDIINMQAAGLATRLSAINCSRAVIGLSGGLDSTLAFIVTVHAFDQLGISRENIQAVTMPCFGTTSRTKNNSVELAKSYGVPIKEINIKASVMQHFADIEHNPDDHDVTYENSQARERTQVLMDIANQCSGIVVGTGDLSELALGWATYNGDHMSMYGVNGSIPKTLVRHLVCYEAKRVKDTEPKLSEVLMDIFNTPVSPELLPPDESGNIAQKTEDIVGPYELHDFYLYYFFRYGFAPSKIYRMAKVAFDGVYDEDTIYKWLKTFVRRFFTQQFKRSCLPDGPKVGTVALSPRGDLRMSSDTSFAVWMADLDSARSE